MRRAIAFTAALVVLISTLASPARSAQLVTSYPVGTQPFGIALDPASGYLYVANSGMRMIDGTGRVSVVDPAGPVSSLSTTTTANVVAVDEAARRLWVSEADSSGSARALDVFDVDSRTRLTTLPVGGLGLAVDATRVYVAGSRDLTAVDKTTFATTTIAAPAGEAWFGVAVDPGLGRVYVTNISNSHPTLVVLDAASLAVIQEVALPAVPRFAVAVDADRHYVYVAGSDPNGSPFAGSAVVLIDGASGAVLRSVALAGFPGAVVRNPARHSVWVTLMDRGIAELDDTTLAVRTGVVAMPWQPSLAAFGADGRLYVGGYSAGVLGAVDVAADSTPVVDAVRLSPADPVTNQSVTAIASRSLRPMRARRLYSLPCPPRAIPTVMP